MRGMREREETAAAKSMDEKEAAACENLRKIVDALLFPPLAGPWRVPVPSKKQMSHSRVVRNFRGPRRGVAIRAGLRRAEDPRESIQ